MNGWVIVGAIGLLILAGGGASLLASFRIKEGVYGVLQPVMDPALVAVRQVWGTHNLGYATITSIEDGEHMATSKHYEGLAFDIRLNDVPAELHAALKQEVQALAGRAFQVIHEYHGMARDHLHIEYDPT